MNIKFIAIPAIAMAAGLGMAACGSQPASRAAPAATHSSSAPAAAAPTQAPASAATTPAAPSTLAACQALAAWENGPATDTLQNDPAHMTILQLGTGTQFGVDFATWMIDVAMFDTQAAQADGQTVRNDCSAVGVNY